MDTKPFATDDRFKELKIPGVINHYSGKVREAYFLEGGYVALVATDRISAFDCIMPWSIPLKGVILNKMTEHFYERLGHTVPHYFIGSPHPRVLLGYACKRIDVEVIRRRYIVGSLWRMYQSGKHNCWGYKLPDGLREGEELPFTMLTPTTKAESGHDADITSAEIIEQKLCTPEQWEQIVAHSEELFKLGTTVAKKRGLLLVDTKYEFGIDQYGVVRLIDEVHTPDSSRYFYADGYGVRLQKGEKQKQLSKEFIREWLMEKGFEGKEGQIPPKASYEQIMRFKERYAELCLAMTGIRIGFVDDDPDLIVRQTAEGIRLHGNSLRV